MLYAGALILVPTSTFIDVNEDLRALSDNYKVGVPYALFCAGAGGLLALLSCLVIVGTMLKLILSEDDYESGNHTVVVHDGVNANNQLVPLVNPRAQTSTGGYTQPVTLNSTVESVRKKTVAFKSNIDGGSGKSHGRGNSPKSSHVIVNTHAEDVHSLNNATHIHSA